MIRRYLPLPSSSDEDDSPPRPQAPPTSSPNLRDNPAPPQSSPLEDSSPMRQAPAAPSPPLEISDDDFMDAEDALLEHSLPSGSAQSAGVTPEGVGASASDPSDAFVGAIDEFLRRLGLGLRREWLASCFLCFVDAVPGFEELDVTRKARLCFEHFLLENMNYCGAGILPENVHCMHKVELEGPFVLQVDEVTNVSLPLRERYHDSPAGLKRCLKLSLTDGVQHVFAMEYRPIQDLKVLSAAGLKIIVKNVQIRRGLLLLLPEVVEVLGGLVDYLDAARQRLINEVNKPPRGQRKQALLPLSQRATLAAWPSNTINNNEANTSVSGSNINNNTGLQANISVQPTLSNPQMVVQDLANVTITSDTAIERHYVEEYVDPNTGRVNSEDVSRDNGRCIYGAVPSRESFAKTPDYNSSLNAEPNITSDASVHVQDCYAMDVDDAANELKNPLILNGEKEIPFTYLASLLAKWVIVKDNTSSIQGRIKCILTGVKMFQFKHRSTYELVVYVDDGSYISEVLIDHTVVQNGIGYSPEDVTASLSSSDKKTKADMADIMKKFQLFLSKFEGTMLVEINKDSSLPVGLEMSQGCSASDAWLLLRRLKSFTYKFPQDHSIEPIILSP